MEKKKKYQTNGSAEVATNSYDVADYQSEKEISKGLAMTHEQVSDVYMEGTIDGEIGNVARGIPKQKMSKRK